MRKISCRRILLETEGVCICIVHIGGVELVWGGFMESPRRSLKITPVASSE